MPRLPAEWEPQSAVMLTWPHAGTDWAALLTTVEPLYIRLATLIAGHQQVLVVCHDAALRDHIAGLLVGLPADRVQLAVSPCDDTWARDHGPLTVLDANGTPTLVDFRFNGWGGKFQADQDDAITSRLHADGLFGAAGLVRSELVLEGGAIDVDGAGTLLTVRRTLIDPLRNPGWDAPAIEAEFHRLLGVERVLWLSEGQLTGDDTDGHIDTLARFCDGRTICHATCDDPADPDHASLAALGEELAALRDRDGRPYRLLPLPQPAPIHDPVSGERLPAGYANFLILNDAVLVPVYGDLAADALALRRLAEAFPGRTIEALDCRPLIRQGGSLHCITMQLPGALRHQG